jgi:UDP-N-acetylmuramoyl-L-alanyl-D-glutamate--2,6-diaminopimelate ligase
VIGPQGRVGSPPVDLNLPPVPLAALAVAVGGATRDARDVVISDAAYDSRQVRPGCLFFCVGGTAHDGHSFAPAALDAGAAGLVVERWLPVRAPQVLVGSVREAMGPMSAALFGHPAEAMLMLGVTGTNGKTTTTYLLESILREQGQRAAVIGTTGARIERESIPLDHTTPEAPDLHRLLATMRASGVTAVALEVSSHALAFHRVGGVRFDVTAFTNLSQDHLDLHGSMESYFAAKARLFTAAYARMGVVNADDPWGQRLLGDASVPLRTFGMRNPADRYATDLESDAAGSRFVVGPQRIVTPLLGAFNASNALCAFTMAEAAGVEPWMAVDGIRRLSVVPGRTERIDAGQPFLVMVDYAHTPDSIQHVLRGARPLATGRTIVVFGCGGDRDRAKRSPMGRVAATEADVCVLTSDNPRSEDPDVIIEEILEGARGGSAEIVVEPDRRLAIRAAFGLAREGDVVVIAGKGHERTQDLGGKLIVFDDRDVARDELSSWPGSG